ncbi:MAG: LPXTG cell wall anchor domain-containing protein, partial [Limosilactobacillus reuteri]|nr:LPXTG cell wall anchor domain-containing protein [Limosilactobacillus reuteri]
VEMPTSDSEKSQKVKVEADKTATTKVQFSDKLVKKEEDKGNLEISKYVKKDDGSADTSNPVKGVEFTITGPDGSSVTKETDENGQISLTDLTPGEYTVTETSVEKSNPVVEMPTSDSEKSQKVKVEADKKAITKVQFSDKLKPETPSKPETPEKTGTFTVQKYIEGTTTSVAGVQFKITGPDAQVNGKTYETGSDGKIKMPSSLKAGTYTVFELTKPGKGFLDNVVLKEQSQTITIKSDGTTDKANGVLTFYDAKKETTKPEAKTGTFMIQKYIKNTSTGVPGVQFQITGPDDQVNKKTFTTDSNGQVKLPDSLKPGEYTVTELTTAGTGFNDTVQLVSQTQKVMIAEDGTTKLPSNVMTFYDEAKPVTPTQPVDQKGSLLIQKYIEGTKTGVAGVQFTVAGPNGSKTYTTNASGQIVLSSLKLGMYVVTEQTTAGEGFKDEVVLTSQSKSVELGANNLSDTLTFYDAKKPTTPSTPEKPESEKPTTPEKPESETPTTPEKPESETPTTPEKPESEKPSTPKKSKSEKPKKTTKKKASKKKTPSLPGSPGTPSLPGSPGTPSLPGSPGTSGQSSSSAQSSGSKQSQSASGLPQTGEADSMILIVLGLLIAFSAMLIFYYVEKKSK